jgi:hypothetical protein
VVALTFEVINYHYYYNLGYFHFADFPHLIEQVAGYLNDQFGLNIYLFWDLCNRWKEDRMALFEIKLILIKLREIN